MCCVCECYNGDIVAMDLFGVEFVRGSISSELIMCTGGAHSIVLLPRVARCLEIPDVCIWRMFVSCLL